MLTIKVIIPNGPEYIMEAVETRFECPADGLTANERALVLTQRNGDDYRLESGRTVYVMNENGKTVATYHL